MWGRAVADHGFVRALAVAPQPLRLTLFVPTRRDVVTLQATLLAGLPHRVNVVPMGGVADFLARDPIDALHVLDPNMWIGAHIRNRLSQSAFPITGMTHSLANEHFLDWALLNSANGVQAGDCLVCTTPSAQAVVDNALARLSAGQPGFSAPATTVIPLGIPLEDFRQPASPQRRELGLAADDFVILSLSRFNPHFKMDLQPLLNLCTLLARQVRRPVRLLLAGAADNGAYARFLQERVRERGLGDVVRFVLDCSEAEKLALYRTADVFLSLSDNIQETFGLTVIEAMAAGLPVVASDWDGYKSLVRDGATGFLVPTRTLPGDPDWESTLALQPDALVHIFSAQTTAVDLDVAARRLGQLAADRELARRLGASGAESVLPLAWAQVVARYVELWHRLSSEYPAAAGHARSSALEFLADFAGYGSATLASTDGFVTSSLGEGLLAGKSTDNIYEYLEEFLDQKLMVQLLQAFTRQQSVGSVLATLQDRPGQFPFRIRQNILWLYKYGYLSAAGQG